MGVSLSDVGSDRVGHNKDPCLKGACAPCLFSQDLQTLTFLPLVLVANWSSTGWHLTG